MDKTNLTKSKIGLFLLILLEASIEKGMDNKHPITLPKRDILTVSTSGLTTFLKYPKLGLKI
jgi:hypothetical protein